MGHRDDPGPRWLLTDLCVRLGVCLPPDARRRIEETPPTGIDAFTDAVLEAEGMADMSHTGLRAQVRELVARHLDGRAGPDAPPPYSG